jgi:GNAT superfamily N-acetyltransferase
MLSSRPVDLDTDRDIVLDFHCLANFETDSLAETTGSFTAYRSRWLETRQPRAYLRALTDSLNDSRTIAEIWEENGRPVGYLYVAFSEIDGHGVTVAQVRDIAVSLEHQRRGIGTIMLQHAQERARERGAVLMRAETGVESSASQGLHAKQGFTIHRLLYENRLDGES